MIKTPKLRDVLGGWFNVIACGIVGNVILSLGDDVIAQTVGLGVVLTGIGLGVNVVIMTYKLLRGPRCGK